MKPHAEEEGRLAFRREHAGGPVAQGDDGRPSPDLALTPEGIGGDLTDGADGSFNRLTIDETIPPPPPKVPELPKDEAKLGDLTLRETLAKHRETDEFKSRPINGNGKQ